MKETGLYTRLFGTRQPGPVTLMMSGPQIITFACEVSTITWNDGRLKESTIAPHVCENFPQMSAGVPSPFVSSLQSHDSLSARNGLSVTS